MGSVLVAVINTTVTITRPNWNLQSKLFAFLYLNWRYSNKRSHSGQYLSNDITKPIKKHAAFNSTTFSNDLSNVAINTLHITIAEQEKKEQNNRERWEKKKNRANSLEFIKTKRKYKWNYVSNQRTVSILFNAWAFFKLLEFLWLFNSMSKFIAIFGRKISEKQVDMFSGR